VLASTSHSTRFLYASFATLMRSEPEINCVTPRCRINRAGKRDIHGIFESTCGMLRRRGSGRDDEFKRCVLDGLEICKQLAQLG
jgi:hypothetical protein